MNRDVESLLGAYALDAVDDAERAQVERFLLDHPEHQAEVDALRETAAEILAADADADPPASLRAGVLDSIAETPAPACAPDTVTRRDARPAGKEWSKGRGTGSPGPASAHVRPIDELDARRRSRIGRLGAGLAAAAAIALVAILWSPWERGGADAPTPSSSSAPTGEQMAMQVMHATDAKSYSFTLEATPATVTRSHSMGKAVLSVDPAMPAAPAGKGYQMWWRTSAGTFVSAGMMPAQHAGPVLLSGDAGSMTGVGVTMEPAAGSKQPTSTPLGLVALSG